MSHYRRRAGLCAPLYFYPIFTTNDGVFLAVFFSGRICSGTSLQPLILTAQYRQFCLDA